MEARYRDRATARSSSSASSRAIGSASPTGRAAAASSWTRSCARGSFSHFYGWLQRGPWTRGKVGLFAEALGIDASEAEHALEWYRTLDEFFTRRLEPDARPIDPVPEHLASPCDSRVLALPGIDRAGFMVKQSRVGVEELLGNEHLARRYSGGAALVCRLAPADYHRSHFPESGVAHGERRLAGFLHSVHPIALASGAASFLNRRAVSVLDTVRFGRLAMIEVGALVVGTIVPTYRPGPVERG